MSQIEQNWKMIVYKGKYSKYKYEVFAVEIESKHIPDAKQVFLYNEFNLEFNKKVKPFLAMVGCIDSNTEIEMKTHTNDLIAKGDICQLPAKNDRGFLIDSIDALMGSFIHDDDVEKYYNNIIEYVKNNIYLFAERKSLKADEKISEKTSADATDEKNSTSVSTENETQKSDDTIIEKEIVYDKRIHYGAFLMDKQYTDKYRVVNEGSKEYVTEEMKKINGCYPLAVQISKFKEIAEIDLEQYRVKDILQAFVNRGFVLCGNSHTIEKDLTLSKGNQVRCYVLDIGKDTKGEKPCPVNEQ